MTKNAERDHIMAEVRTMARRHRELNALASGELVHDPALTEEGKPSDSGWELDTPEKLMKAVNETVGDVSLERTFRYISFTGTDKIQVRVETDGNGETDRAHLVILRNGRWESEELDDLDTEDAAWLLEKFMLQDTPE